MMTKKIFLVLNILSLTALADFPPYAGEPPAPTLTADQQARVAKGELVYLLDNTKGETKEGSVAFRVNAKPDAVWKILSDFTKYADWSYKVYSAELYQDNGKGTVAVHFVADVPMITMDYYVINNFSGKGWSTWNTDHSKSNDCVLDTVGYWRTKAVDGNPNQTDVLQYGKLNLTSMCAKGMFGVSGFDAHEMAEQTRKNLKSRAEAL